MTTSLLGRDADWAQLNTMLTQLGKGQGGAAALVLGEAGIGKTRLIDAVADRGEDLGYRSVRIRADESDSLTPLTTLVRGFAHAAADLDETTPLAGPSGTTGGDAWALREIQSMLEKAAASAPVLVTVDDVDRADEFSRHAVRLLVEVLSSSSVGWLMTARSESEQRVSRLRATIAQCGGMIVTLGPLSEAESVGLVEELIGHNAPEQLVSLARDAGGNPFLIRELVHGYRTEETGGHTPTEDSSGNLPLRAHEALRSRLAGLTAEVLDVLEVAAVVGRTFSVAEVAGILHRSPTDLLAAVRVLRASGIVVERDGHLLFRHDLLRESVLSDMATESVKLLHVAVAEARLARGHTPLEVAGHLLAGVGPHDVKMAGVLVEASQRLVESSPSQAVALARRALDITGHDRGEWVRYVAPVLTVLVQAREVDDALRLVATATPDWWSADVEAGIRGALNDALWRQGRTREAMAVVQPVLKRSDLSRASRLHLDLVMARARVLGGTPSEAIAPLETVLTEARAIGDQELVTRALTSQSMAQRFLGHFETSVELAAEAVAGFEPHPATRHADPRVWLARSFMATDRLEEADDLGHALMRDTTTITHHHPDLPLLSATTARLLLAQGRVRDALTEAESGIAAMDAEGGRELATELFACLALAGWYVDGASAAASALERSSELTGHDRFGMNHLELAALFVSDDHDRDQVGALAAPLLDELQRSGGQLVFDPAHGPSIVRTLIAAGLTSEASLVVDACHRLADLNPQIASWQAAHDHAAGLDSDDVDLLRAAARTFATCGRPLASALAEADIAAALRRREDPDWAVQRQGAVSLLRSLGADAAAARLERDLPSGSGRPRRGVREQRPDTGWESLTPAELRVVAVAATGATNKEIAAELWISPYTVDTHMRHILGKLGVRSRVAVARLAAERDLELRTREQ